MPKKADLKTYRAKRDFNKTKEPAGGPKQKSGKTARKTAASADKAKRLVATKDPLFVIQKHAAHRLHYDFRLEVDGVLASWAVPKGPSIDPADKRLAVHVEDHPLEYAAFEGIIPQGEYGGGTVMVWDVGTYKNLREKNGKPMPMRTCVEQGTVEIELQGNKLQGAWALVRTRGSDDKNWLMIKMKDKPSKLKRQPVESKTKSVLTGRSLEQIAAAGDQSVWTTHRK